MDVIVTGSTGGIGSCLVKQAVGSQDIENVYCQYRDQKKFDSLFKKNYPKIISEKWDISCNANDSYIMKKLHEKKVENLTCVFTAFSINPIKRVGTYTLDELKENIYVNVLGMTAFTNQLIQFKQTHNMQLRLINIDSGAAYHPLNGWALYSAAKAYVNMYLKTVQLENSDIKVVSYEPGVVDTPMQEEIRRTDGKIFDQVDKFRDYFDKKTLRDPNKIAEDIINRFILNWEGTDFNEGYGLK